MYIIEGYNDADNPLTMTIESRRKVLIKTFRRLFFFMPFGDIRSMRPSPSIPSMGRIQCIINCAVMRINEQNYEL